MSKLHQLLPSDCLFIKWNCEILGQDFKTPQSEVSSHLKLLSYKTHA